MAIPFVLFDGKLDRATRLRLAILGKSAMDNSARLITIEDVKHQWVHLSVSGLCPRKIFELANGDGDNVTEAQFEAIMRSLNSYL